MELKVKQTLNAILITFDLVLVGRKQQNNKVNVAMATDYSMPPPPLKHTSFPL